MYHSQRQPCRAAMLFIRRKVPDKMPDVSANASFWSRFRSGFVFINGGQGTHHLTELHCRISYFAPYRCCDLWLAKRTWIFQSTGKRKKLQLTYIL
jgi:hypothetical protein